MNVLVTGGAGFIGSHIVDQLIEAGHRGGVIDNLGPAAHDGAPDWLNPEAEWRWADVADPATWHGVLDGLDAVSHQAAKVGLGVDLTDAPAYVTNNDLGTAVMLGAMSAAGWSCRWPGAAPTWRPGAGSPGVRFAEASCRPNWCPRTPRSTRATSTRRPSWPRNTCARPPRPSWGW